ncbi:hypothetical protein LPJ75_006340, partial [Coemansia sp. RSA 2598]
MSFASHSLHPAAAAGPYSLWPRAIKAIQRQQQEQEHLGASFARVVDVRRIHPASITSTPLPRPPA